MSGVMAIGRLLEFAKEKGRDPGWEPRPLYSRAAGSLNPLPQPLAAVGITLAAVIDPITVVIDEVLAAVVDTVAVGIDIAIAVVANAVPVAVTPATDALAPTIAVAVVPVTSLVGYPLLQLGKANVEIALLTRVDAVAGKGTR